MKKVLMLLGGRWHPFGECAAIMADFLTDTACYEFEATEDREVLADLSGYDAVLVYTQGGQLTDAQEKGLLDFVRAGGGLVGIHCASDSFTENEGYMGMLGCRFTGHGRPAQITVEHTEDAGDIIPRVAPKFTVFDEFYKVEMQTDEPVRPFQYGWWEFERLMLGYVRDFGQGRVFYTALGHDERAFKHPEFQDLIFKGIRYVTGQEEKPLQWGIVGYGPLFGMGTHHANFIKATDGLELAAVCDKDPARIEAARTEQGENVDYFLDTADLVKSGACDGVTVVVPHNVHLDVTLPLIHGGLHVVSEKPFAVTPEECDRMIQAAREADVMLSVYHSRHWDTDMWTIREIVESGMIGEVFAIEHNMCGYGRPGQAWRSHKAISGGLLYDMGAHGFEKIFQIVPKTNATGEKINRAAQCYGNFLKKVWFDTTNEDYARAWVRFDTGLEAMLTQSRISAAPRPGWIVSGTKGSCVTVEEGVEVRHYENGAVQTTLVPFVQGLSWQSYYRNIGDHLHAGVPLIITPELAKATIQCIHGCEVASREGRLVEVQFDF